jgi:hypothetical protein
MSIFISYSHKDKNFVDKLALILVDKRIKVFVDRWEMKLGDSITTKIEDAISDASYLMVILSKSSVSSDWCKREITTALMLELERKRIVLLPVLIEDCEIPLFLRDKYYADFRDSFENGLETVLESLSNMDNDIFGRISDVNAPSTLSDFAINWGLRGNRFELNIDVVEYSTDENAPFTVLTNIVFIGNESATKRFLEQVEAEQMDLMKNTILMICAENEFKENNAYLYDNQPFEQTLELRDSRTDSGFKGFVKVKKIGVSDGKDKIYYYGRIFEKIWSDEVNEKTTANKS